MLMCVNVKMNDKSWWQCLILLYPIFVLFFGGFFTERWANSSGGLKSVTLYFKILVTKM